MEQALDRDPLAGIGGEFYVFGCHFNLLLVWWPPHPKERGLPRLSKDEPICFALVLRDGGEERPP